MWTTVLILALAVNFEPTRIGLMPLLLVRDRPILQLLAYIIGSFSVSLTFGFLVLFVFHRNPFGISASGGGKAQIAVGVAVLLVGLTMAVRWARGRRHSERKPLATNASEDKPASAVGTFTAFVGAILRRYRSPWQAGLIGVGSGLPSIDYLAVLFVIADSQKSPMEQSAALLTCVLLGSLVVMVPLIGYLISPAKTLHSIGRFASWTRSRSQIEYAALLGLLGLLLIGLGASHL